MIPVLTAAHVEPLLDWLELTEALAEGHRQGEPELRDVLLASGERRLLSRAAWIAGFGIGVKSVTVFPDNPRHGRPSVQGAMVVFDEATGAVAAVLDNALITKWKTAADSLLGAKLLMPPKARRLTILGAGAVAASLIEAYRALIPGLEIRVWARRPEAAAALCARYPGAEPSADRVAAVAWADLVACATMAEEPILKGAWLRPGQHIDLIGAFTPTMREADDEVLRRGRLFVDSRATTIGHIGELIIPMAKGVITEADVLGDLYDLVAGRAGRQTAEEITIFKNGGGAHLDLMTARYILARWHACSASS